MAGAEHRFLSRWSRLKRRAAVEAPAGRGAAAPVVPAVDEPATGASEAGDSPAVVETRPEPPELPDPATLTKDSDFTVFLRAGVPEDLQRQALRTLWKSDPIFSHHDGLTDYAEDFANPDVVGDAVKTAWKVGKGFFFAEDDATPQLAAESPGEATPDPEAEPEDPPSGTPSR